ncbi:MAG: hypothetical protein IIZ92_21250 [Aquincola sp.]|uniref:hypothetical protein n=1 Tax=uncultured Aquincola sp. TaxID=886556 RepID=UPI0032B1B661|nr:hypothetical protein [Aquincola sp.]|tara:strand:+ start:401 stop:625 length:225 start_codon:yes stop_codon:yes gene_type:complete
MKMLLDTNLLVSSIISYGVPRRLLDGARRGEFGLVSSESVLSELLPLQHHAGIPIVTAREALDRVEARTPPIEP